MALQPTEARNGEELERGLAALIRERPSALLMTADGVHQRLIDDILAFASKNRLPVMYQVKENVERGGLMSYGADVPVEQPTKFEFVINVKTAKALGLTIPPSLLERANQVIK